MNADVSTSATHIIQKSMPMHCDCCEVSKQQDVLAVAMYELDDSGQRLGRIQLFSMTHGDEGGSDLNYGAAIDCSGVFDAKWVGGVHGIRGTSSAQQQHSSSTANTESDLMAVALADGSCTLMQAAFSSIQSVSVCEDAAVGGMALSCNWGPGQDVVYCSSSNGHVASCRVTDANLELETSWAAHDMEVWMVSCDLHRAGVVYTGADDSSFKGWDARDTASPAFCLRKAHGAGVCCIQSNPHRDTQVATGSYDECVRLWDLRMLCSPMMTQKVKTSGGVWRFKWHPEQPDRALLACMQSGFALASFGEHDLSMWSYPHQKILAYGADWWLQGGKWWAATCSFYDRSLHVWCCTD